MDFPPIEEALASLAAVDPADLSRVASLRAMHAECAAAGVFAGDLGTSAASAAAARAAVGDECAPDVAKLHQIFDAAVRRGVSQLVCHYVDEVCGHDDFSSPDGVEAYLQDGECVAEWAYAALRAAEGEIERAPHHDRPADALDRAAAVLEALREILRALGADPEAASEPEASSASSASSAAPADSRLQRAHDDAARGAQLAAARLGARRRPRRRRRGDRHGGPAAWAGSVAARRAAALAASNAVALPPAADAGGLFLDDLLSGVGATTCPYPFRSVVEAASRVFAGGSAAPAALVAKQSLFLYYLLDKDGATSDLPGTLSAASYARSARTPARLFSETRAAALLDDAFENQSGGKTRALDEAAALVPAFADSRAPAKFVAALCARGRPEAALAAQRSRERGGPLAGASAPSELVDPSDPAAAAEAEAEAETERELGVALRLE